METIRLYRAVSFAEKEDILTLNGFRAKAGAFEGKQFWGTKKDALWFQAWCLATENEAYFIVEVDVDISILAEIQESGLDIRNAYTVDKQTLSIFNKKIINIQFL